MPGQTHSTSAVQVAALTNPLRHKIWRAVDEDGATVSQLTNRLRTNKGNVAHHVKVLVDAGLLARGRSRTVRGGTEQYYVRTATRVKITGDHGPATRAMIESVTDEIADDPNALLNHRTVRMSRQQAIALARHLDQVVTDLPPANPGEQTYGVMVSVYRKGGGPGRGSSQGR